MFAVVARSTPFSKDIIQLVLSFHEQILSITETKTKIESDACFYGGFVVKTTDQVIKFLIQDEQLCCEDYGWQLYSIQCKRSLIENQQLFANAIVTSVSWASKLLDPECSFQKDEFAAINIVTCSGTLQLVLYNEHDGYYPHNIYCSWKNYEDKQTL